MWMSQGSKSLEARDREYNSSPGPKAQSPGTEGHDRGGRGGTMNCHGIWVRISGGFWDLLVCSCRVSHLEAGKREMPEPVCYQWG